MPIAPRLLVRSFVLAMMVVASAAALAADPVARDPSYDLRDRYPPTSIDSVPKADAALAAAKSDRTRVETDYKSTARACMDKFLVNDCLNQARDLQRKRLADIDAVEVEANRYKRRDRAARNDAVSAKRESEREAKEAAESGTRAKNREAYEQRQEQARRDAARGPKSSGGKPMTPPKPDGVTPEQRAKNADNQAKKVKDAAEHREKLAKQHAEKEADRARRAAAKAAKAAQSAPPAETAPKPSD